MRAGAGTPEQKRLAALEKLEILDSGREREFDALAETASLVCGTPVALISLIGEERQWFKANVGFDGVSENDRKIAFCNHTIMRDDLMEVADTALDPRFADSPIVVNKPNIRYYAGVPLKLSTGENVGTICVADFSPRHLSEEKKQILRLLADAAALAMETRVAARHEHDFLAAESRARSILEHSFDAILTMGPDGIIRHWNKAAELMFGYTAEEAEGRSLALILADDRRESELDLTGRLQSDRGVQPLRTERRRKDGAMLAVSVSIGPVVNADGVMIGATEIIHDITDMVRAHEERSEAERRVTRLYNETPAMLHSINAEGRIISVSNRWLEVLGYERDEVIGQYSSSFLTEASKAKARDEVLPAFFREGRCDNIEYQMVTKSGAVIDVLLSAILERSDTGAPQRTMATIENITERRRAEQALQDERRRLEQIIEATQAGTWEWNLKTGDLRVNAQWSSVIGFSSEELDAFNLEKWRARMHPDDMVKNRALLDAYLNGDSDSYDSEMRLRHRDGHWIWVLSRGRIVSRSEDGEPEWMFGSLQDISCRKREEQDLRKSEEFLERTGRMAGIGGWELDLATNEIFWSNETCRIHGVDLDYKPELEEALDFYPPEARDVVAAAVERGMSTGESWDLELPFNQASGKRIWVRAVGLVQFEDGKPAKLVGAFQDISAQVSQRKALEEVNERIAVATRNGRIGIWDANLETGKTLYSDIWCELLGYTTEEISDDGRQWIEFVHPDDAERALQADVEHIRGDAPHFEEQFRMRHKDGHWVWILDRGQITARNENGDPIRMIGTHTDITRQKQAEEERRLLDERMAIATKSGGIGIWEVELLTQKAHWDSRMFRLFGRPEALDVPVFDIWNEQVYPEDRQRVEAAIFARAADRGQMDDEYRIVWPDGSIHHIHVSAMVHIDDDGQAQRLIGAAWDVTHLRQMAMDLAEQHELMRITLASIGDAVITTDAEARVQWLNPVAEQMTGWSVAEAMGLPSSRVFDIVNEETRKKAADPIITCLELGEIVGLADETLLLSRDGREYGVEDSTAPIRSVEGEILGAVLVFHDVSEQRRLSREMSYRASHDQLTGLVNRAEFDRRIADVFEKTLLDDTQSALLYIDLDRFKIVNDTGGHAVGDELLKQVSRLISGAVRAGDTTARLGGDEFAVILEQCQLAAARRIAQQICDRVHDFQFVHDGKSFRVGASIGLVVIDKTARSVAAVLQAADLACYTAKASGRNRIHVWEESDEAMKAKSGETRWATRIEHALQHDRFVLYGQNIVPLDIGSPGKTHTELLLRMLDENGDIILPSSFLPAAERFNLATDIDQWVLSHVLDWMKGKADLPENHSVSVNLSGQSLGDRAFHKWAVGMLNKADAAVCSRLCLEITETAVITNMSDAMIFIEAVRKLGVSIALDDFGSGLSSFGYLRHFTIDYLKIDGQFIRKLSEDALSEATVNCFIAVAKVLGVKTVAEYVSDPMIASKLRALGVDYAQGFYIHKPEPIVDFTVGRSRERETLND